MIHGVRNRRDTACTDILAGRERACAMGMVFFLDTADQFYPREGEVLGGDRIIWGAGSGQWWAAKKGCDSRPKVIPLPDVEDEGTRVDRWVYAECPPAAQVEFHAIHGGDHTWPGSPYDQGFLGRVPRGVNASEVLVESLAPFGG